MPLVNLYKGFGHGFGFRPAYAYKYQRTGQEFLPRPFNSLAVDKLHHCAHESQRHILRATLFRLDRNSMIFLLQNKTPLSYLPATVLKSNLQRVLLSLCTPVRRPVTSRPGPLFFSDKGPAVDR